MTTNEMIYKTITTKLTKEPTYKTILEDLGYEVYDSEWSGYGNWTVKNKANGKEIVLSKDYDNKRGLFDGAYRIKCTDIKKVNYVDFLNKNRNNQVNSYFDMFGGEYHELRYIIKDSKRAIKYSNEYIDEAKEKIKELNKDIKRWKERIYEKQKKLDEVRQRVAELKAR